MGPPNNPPPGAYSPQAPPSRAAALHMPLHRPPADVPGPADYAVRAELTQGKAPEWGPLNYTAPRKSPFDQVSKDAATETQRMQRIVEEVAAELAATKKAGVRGQLSHEDALKATGPSWSMRGW